MLLFVVAVAAFGVVRGDLLPTLTQDLTFSCRDANDDIDTALANSNFDMKSRGQDNWLVDIEGFDATVHLYAFGWKLPMSVWMNVTMGNLTGINTLKRSTDATDCSTSFTRTAEGIFEYGPELSMTYDSSSARFLFWEVQGKFAFKSKPRMHVALFNGLYCRFESISPENPGQSEYIFTTEPSWKGWLISKLLSWGLQQKDDTLLESSVNLWSQGKIADSFTDAWCSLVNKVTP